MDINTNRKVGGNPATTDTEKPQGQLVGRIHLDVVPSQIIDGEKQPDTITEKLYNLIEDYKENSPSTGGMQFTGRLANGTENVSKEHKKSGRIYEAISHLGMSVSGWLRRSDNDGKKTISIPLTYFETAKDKTIAAKNKTIADQGATIADQDATIADQDKRIQELEAAAAAK